jgi:regulator of sigma E protease
MSFLNVIYVVAGMLLLFGAAVFVHEFGHYWMARRRGLKVEAFAIGFGPKIISWTRDGIEYSWRWIPAGGFVKLPQMITSEAIEGQNSQEALPPAPPGARILVAFAGPFMNVVFAFVIATFLYFVGLPMLVDPPIVGPVEPESVEAQAGVREGDKVVTVDGQKIRSWNDIMMASVLSRSTVLPVVLERDGDRFEVELPTTVNPAFGWKMLNLHPQDNPEILEVMPDGAAAKAGLEPGDVVLSFAGMPTAGRSQFIDLIQKRGGEPSEMMVQRGEEIVPLQITPQVDPSTGVGRIGVALGSPNVFVVERPGPLPWVQVADVWDKTVRTLRALWYGRETGVGVKDLSGPPGILAMLAAQINMDYRLALSFLVLLNINLAIINLFPVPVLDGGHIMMAIVEKIRRRPLSMRFVEYTTTAFALLLITFMIYVSYNDVKRFGIFRHMFQSDTRIEEQQKPEAPEAAPVPSP